MYCTDRGKVPSSGWEYLCVKLSHRKPKSKIYVLCNIYRKPNKIVNDLDTLSNKLSTLLITVKKPRTFNIRLWRL